MSKKEMSNIAGLSLADLARAFFESVQKCEKTINRMFLQNEELRAIQEKHWAFFQHFKDFQNIFCKKFFFHCTPDAFLKALPLFEQMEEDFYYLYQDLLFAGASLQDFGLAISFVLGNAIDAIDNPNVGIEEDSDLISLNGVPFSALYGDYLCVRATLEDVQCCARWLEQKQANHLASIKNDLVLARAEAKSEKRRADGLETSFTAKRRAVKSAPLAASLVKK